MEPIDFDLLDYREKLLVRKEGDQRHVFDIVRKKWLLLTSEEFVRQLFIHHFISTLNIPKSWISIEKGLMVHGVHRRYDILIFDQNTEPFILVECKAPSVQISQSVFDQIVEYNMTLNVPYLVITNGLSHYCCQIDHNHQSFKFMSTLPEINEN